MSNVVEIFVIYERTVNAYHNINETRVADLAFTQDEADRKLSILMGQVSNDFKAIERIMPGDNIPTILFGRSYRIRQMFFTSESFELKKIALPTPVLGPKKGGAKKATEKLKKQIKKVVSKSKKRK